MRLCIPQISRGTLMRRTSHHFLNARPQSRKAQLPLLNRTAFQSVHLVRYIGPSRKCVQTSTVICLHPSRLSRRRRSTPRRRFRNARLCQGKSSRGRGRRSSARYVDRQCRSSTIFRSSRLRALHRNASATRPHLVISISQNSPIFSLRPHVRNS